MEEALKDAGGVLLICIIGLLLFLLLALFLIFKEPFGF